MSLLLAVQVRAEVSFSGLDEALEQNARALMRLATAPCDAPEWRVRKLFRDADAQLQDALEALGHYRFSVDKRISFQDTECWSAEFEVSLDEPVRVRDVAVNIAGDAKDDADLAERTKLPALVPGSVLNHGAYESYKKSLLSDLTTRGYFEAAFTESSVTVDTTLTHADIDILVESGPRYRFGDIRFTEGILTPALLGAHADFQSGDPYDAGAISRLHESLNGSGYFASVEIQAEPAAGPEKLVPVFVRLTPTRRRVFTVGAGYATDTGIQGRLGYTNRRRNEQGHQFDARLFLSQVDSELTGTYRWPRGNPDAEWVDSDGGGLRKRTETSSSDKTTHGVRVARTRGKKWLETPYLDFTGEDFKVGEQVDSSRLKGRCECVK